jgi:hypothetical protein
VVAIPNPKCGGITFKTKNMNENYFDDLLNYLTSEQKDSLYFLLEGFVKSNTITPKGVVLLESMLKDICES